MSAISSRPVAIVTGGSRGIGRAICEELARQNFAVVVNYATRPDAAAEVVAQIEQQGGQAITVGASVADAAARAHLLATTLERFGRLDVLVNNAGITSPGRKDILEATEEAWETVFDTNLKGPFFLSQQAALRMIEFIQAGIIPHGRIINMSSISEYAVSTNRADYCLTKAAIGMMTELFATRLAEENINVYEIRPGVIASDMTAAVKDKYDRLIAEGLTPIKRWGQPEDVAKAVAALALNYFPFSTGDRFNVDGGFHIRRV